MNAQQLQGLIIPIGFFCSFFYLFAIRPQKKKEKEIQEMRSNLAVGGDEVVTIGGIYGKIIVLKEDIVTLEVSSAKTRLDVTKWSIGSVINKK